MKKLGTVYAEGGSLSVYEDGKKCFWITSPIIWDDELDEEVVSNSSKKSREFDSLIDLLSALPDRLGFLREGEQGVPVEIGRMLREGRD